MMSLRFLVLLAVLAVSFGSRALAADESVALRKATENNVDDMVKTMKNAPGEQRYYLAQKVYWLRGNFELCSFSSESTSRDACLKRLQPEGTPPFRDIQIGEFREACSAVSDAKRKKDCAAAAKRAQQNFEGFADEAKMLLPRDGAIAGGAKFAERSPKLDAVDQDLVKLSDKMLKASEGFIDRSESAVGAKAPSTETGAPKTSTGEK